MRACGFRRDDGRQSFLSQSEDDRSAAEAREAAAVSEAKGMQQAVRAAEERLQQAHAELEVSCIPRGAHRTFCRMLPKVSLPLLWQRGVCFMLLFVRAEQLHCTWG